MKIKDIIKNNEIKKEDKLTEYLHSYLAWLYYQNNHFHESLTNEEIANYFIRNIKHDNWLDEYIKENPLLTISHIYEFIDSYKYDAHIFQYTIDIVPSIDGPYKKMNKEA